MNALKGLAVGLAFILALSVTTVASKKMVVTYLGTDFILPGGCPPPPCNPTKDRNCRKEHIDMEAQFNDCMVDNKGEELKKCAKISLH